MKTCGNCIFGAVVSQDLTKRVCKGMPPQVVIMPTPQGAQMQFHFPVVESAQAGCALHKGKINIDSGSHIPVEH